MKPKKLHSERLELIAHIEQLLETPIAILGFIWLVLLIIEMVHGLTPALRIASIIIWGIFVIDFVMRLVIAPDKIAYFKKEWLIALSLFLPAVRFLRVFRFLRILSAIQAGSLITMLGSINRSIKSLNNTLERRGFIYVVFLTLAVIFLGAAGMYAFEKGQHGTFKSYFDAVWWTTMMLMTIGSQYWPHTAAGKILSVLVSIYGFSVLGYITATLASFFVDRDTERRDKSLGGSNEMNALKKEIEKLTESIEELKKLHEK